MQCLYTYLYLSSLCHERHEHPLKPRVFSYTIHQYYKLQSFGSALKECSWMVPIHGHCIVMLRCKLITIGLSFIRRSLSVFRLWGSPVHQTPHAVITLTIHYDQQWHAAIIPYIPQQTLKSRAIKGKERGVAVSRVLAAQARGPGFDPRWRHLSFCPLCRFKGLQTVTAPIVFH